MKGGSRQSDEIHQRVYTKLIKEYEFTEEEAKAVKHILYSKVKEQLPNGNNEEKAKMLEELVNDPAEIKAISSKDIKKVLKKFEDNPKPPSRKAQGVSRMKVRAVAVVGARKSSVKKASKKKTSAKKAPVKKTSAKKASAKKASKKASAKKASKKTSAKKKVSKKTSKK